MDTYSEVNLEGSYFWENRVEKNGVIQSLGRSRLNATNVCFERSRGLETGSALSAFGLSRIIIEKSSFKRNTGYEGTVLFSLNINRVILIKVINQIEI